MAVVGLLHILAESTPPSIFSPRYTAIIHCAHQTLIHEYMSSSAYEPDETIRVRDGVLDVAVIFLTVALCVSCTGT